MRSVSVPLLFLLVLVPTISVTAVSNCKAGFNLVGDSCYQHFDLASGLNFSYAKEACEELGSHLVTLTSLAEEDALFDDYLSDDVWIGLEETSTDVWEWVNGEPFVYVNWDPSPHPETTKCARMNIVTRSWKTKGCGGVKPYVCETAPDTPTLQPSGEPSGEPSGQPTSQPSVQPTSTPSSLPSSQPSGQPSGQPSSQPSGVPTGQPSTEPTGVPTAQPTGEPSGAPSVIPSGKPSGDPTGQPSSVPSSDPSASPTGEPSGRPSGTPSVQPSAVPSVVPTAEPSGVPSMKPSGKPTTVPSGSPSGEPTGAPSGSPSIQPSGEPTRQPSSEPSTEPSGEPSGKPTTVPSGSPSGVPTGAPSTKPSGSPSVQPSGEPTRQPSSEPSTEPSGEPSGKPTTVSSGSPSGVPTGAPSTKPSDSPSVQPSGEPTHQPSSEPSAEPSSLPTGWPSVVPTGNPSGSPSGEPSGDPSAAPSVNPSVRPSGVPSSSPSRAPSEEPTGEPTCQPSSNPSGIPSQRPSGVPSSGPSVHPTGEPTSGPTGIPSAIPTGQPTREPTVQPTSQPSNDPSSTPSISPSENMYHDFAPDILGMSTNYSNVTDVIRIDLELSGAAIVHCGVFSNNDNSRAVNVTAASIRFQGWFNITLSSHASVSVRGLKALGKYQLYCMTSSLDDMNEMALGNILNTKFEGEVEHCKIVHVDLHTKNILVSDFLQSTASVKVDGSACYFEDFVVLIAIQNTSELHCANDEVVVSPQTMRFTSGRDSSVEVYASSMCAGDFDLVVSIYAAEAFDNWNQSIHDVVSHEPIISDFFVEYSNGRTYHVFSSDQSFLAPEAIRASMVSDSNEVEILFNSYTNYADLQGITFACDKLMSFNGASSATCYWRDSTRLIITLNSFSTLQLGDVFTVLGGVNSSAVSSPMASIAKNLQVSSREIMIPEIRISAPTHLSSCSPFALDLVASSGHGGRPWLNVSIFVRSIGNFSVGIEPIENNATELVLLNSFFANIYDIQSVTEVPTEYLIPGHIYVFNICLCNYLGLCGVASHLLSVSETFPFSMQMSAINTRRSVVRSGTFQISSAVYRSTCKFGPWFVISSINQTWAVFDAGDISGRDTLYFSESNSTHPLILPPHSLIADKLYKVLESVRVTVADNVTNVERVITFTSSVFIKCERAPVKALVSLNGAVMVGLNETKHISGSGSYDLNVPSFTTSSSVNELKFYWKCVRLGPLTEGSSGTDCAGFLRVNDSAGSTALLSPSFIGDGTHFADSEYEITLLVVSADGMESDTVSWAASIVSFCCISIELAPVHLYYPMHDVIVTANVQSTVPGYLVWTIEGITYGQLSDVALTPIDFVFESSWLSLNAYRPVYLVLPPYTLLTGIAYTIQLSFIPTIDGVPVASSVVYSSIEILPSSPPQAGLFTVSPDKGVRLLDEFEFRASLWSSDNFPLRYSFGFRSISSGTVVPVSSTSVVAVKTCMLPQGNKQNSYRLSCVLRVYDVHEAGSNLTTTVQVTPGAVDRTTLSNRLEEIANGDVGEFNSVFGPVLETITEVNCSLAPDCLLYSRHNCTAFPHTCGPCLSEVLYFGEEGHHNSRCSRRDAVTVANATCLSDSDCPVFRNCLEGKCVSEIKKCQADCNGNGQCNHFVKSSGKYLRNGMQCQVGDSTCVVGCSCEVGWYGADCSLSYGNLLRDSSLYTQSVCLLSDVIVRSIESTAEAIGNWVDQLAILSQNPYLFTHGSSACSLIAQSHILEVISKSSSSISFNTIQTILSSSSTVLDFHKFVDHSNHTNAQKLERLDLLKSVLYAYCEVVSNVMVIDQYPLEAAAHRVRVMSTLLERDVVLENNSSETSLSFTASEQENYNGVRMSRVSLTRPPSTGGWCLISMDAVIYDDFTNDAQKSNSLTVFTHQGNTSVDAFEDEMLVVTIEGVSDIDMLQDLPRTSYNVTCTPSEFGSILYQACPYNMTHELFCNASSEGVWEMTCPSVTNNITCASINQDLSNYAVGNVNCVAKIVSATTVECECPVGALYPQLVIDGSRRSEGDDSETTADVELTAMVAFVAEDFVSMWAKVGELSPSTVEESMAATMTVAFVIIFVALGLMFTDDADKKDAAAEKSGRKIRPIEEEESYKESGNPVINLDALFPSLLTEEPFFFLFFEELRKSHRWVSIYFSYDKNFPRSMRFLLLVSVVICTLFFNTLLYNISDPDDGTCAQHNIEGKCLEKSSPYSTHDTMCYWRSSDEGGSCHFREPSSSAMTVVFVATMSAILSVPFLIICEYVIMDILCRPTIENNTRIQPVPTRVRKADIDVNVLDGIIKANADLRKLLSGLLEHMESLPPRDRNELERLWGITESLINRYLTSTRPLTMESGNSGHELIANSNLNIGGNVVRPVTHVEKDESHDVAVTRLSAGPSLFRRTVMAFSSPNELSVFEDVLGDIISVRASVEKEAVRFVNMSPAERGVRLLVLFQKDLLANLTGEIVEKKSMQGRMVSLTPVSKWTKVSAYLFISFLNLGLLFYILLFAINQDRSRQIAWLLSYVIWLVLEIFVVSCLVMLMSQFVVPYIMIAEVKATKAMMIETVYGYQSKLLDRSDGRTQTKTEFNSAPYLFMSSRLAERFPEGLESEIIQEFTTNMPKRTYVNVSNSALNLYRKRLRITAMSLILLSLERCIYDLICWAGLGFLILWQIVVFRGRTPLAITVYVCVFIVIVVLFHSHYKTASDARTKERAGVIVIRSALEEVETNVRNGNATMAQRIMHDVVARFGRQRSSKKKLNPRLTMVLKSLTKSPAYQFGKTHESKMSHDEGPRIIVSSSVAGEVEKREEVKEDHNVDQGESTARELLVKPDCTITHELSTSKQRPVYDISSSESDDSDRNAVTGSNGTAIRSSQRSDSDSDDSDDSESDDSDSDSDSESDSESDSDSDSDDSESDDSESDSESDSDSDSDASDSDGHDDVDKSKGGAGSDSYSDSDDSDPEGIIIDESRHALLTSNVVDAFSKSQYRNSLAARIHRNREGIQKIAIKRKADDIGESFILNTEKHRASILADQARAQSKLEKRLSLVKNPQIRDDQEGRAGSSEEGVIRDDLKKVVPIRRQNSSRVRRVPNANDAASSNEGGFRTLKKLSSFEVFQEKKAMVSNFTAHQSLNNHRLDAQRRASKALLERKIGTKNQRSFDNEN